MSIRVAFGTFALLFLGVYGDSAEWWKTMALYQIYPRSFKDSDGDGIGDLKGIHSKLEHLVESNIDAFWLSPIQPSPMVDFGYDISDFRGIEPLFGTMEDFDNLLKKAHDLKLKVILDLVPNHSSHEHEWFKKSVKKIEPYTNYYTWREGKVIKGERQPPNNWVSVFGGSAWTWNEERQAYYLHQFAAGQPDLNYRNEKVVEEMKNVMRFWLDKGVDGFRIDAVPHLFEIEDLRDEPLTGNSNDPNSYSYTSHIYTTDQIETYNMVQEWSNVLKEYEATGNTRIIMIEAYTNITNTMNYYTHGANFPFNFGMITSLNSGSSAQDFKNVVDNWIFNLPKGATSNWVAGNHDQSRLVTRYGRDLAPAVQTLVHLLPGISVTYNGEEIGMEDTWLSWEETQDPQGCNAGEEGYEKASRDPERTPFQWDDSVSAGFSTNPKTWLRVNDNYVTVNLAAQKAADKSYYKTFMKIIDLRKLPTIKKGDLETQLLHKNVFAFSRFLEGEKSIYVLLNAGNQPETVSLKAFKNSPAKVQQYLSTSETESNIDGEIFSSENLTVYPRSASIFISSD